MSSLGRSRRPEQFTAFKQLAEEEVSEKQRPERWEESRRAQACGASGRQGVGGVDWSVETSAVPPRTGTEEWLFHWAEWLLEPFEECFSGVPG